MKKIYVKKIEKCHTIGPIKPNAIAGQTKKKKKKKNRNREYIYIETD